jgi:hypothetical protein
MPSLSPNCKNPPCMPRGLVVALALLISGVTLTHRVHAQSDNFDTGTDAGWSKITNPNYPATYSFPTDVFGGKAYRLQAAAPPGTLGGANTARAVVYRSDRLYTNFYVAADIVGWDSNFANGQVFGLLARATGIESGLINAVTLTVRINHVRDAAGSRGRAQIYGFAAGGVGSLVAQDYCTLVPGRKYRFVLSAVGNIYKAEIYDLEDLTHPLASMTGDDAVANSGFFGPPLPDPTAGGYSGIYNISLDGSDPTTDTTFDNFVAAELPPNSVIAPATPHGLTGAPQVINRSPASFSNFYAAAGGITFNATTLTTTNAINTNAIRLYLNNLDVSSDLNIAGPATNATVSYNRVVSNVVYEARIELQDALGRKTTNAWTFDTFSQAYLASARAKNIECEDFDFLGGQFIDNPPPSGYSTNDPGNTTQINGGGVGYVDLDATTGVDFFDYDSNPRTDERDFRFFDSVGTQRGLIAGYYSDVNYATLTPWHRSLDTQRQKYFMVDPALHEYVVERTEGGEWLNYTRVFTNSSHFNVYLRYNSGLEQPVSLGVLPGPTELGTFHVKSSCTLGNNYRYAPLLAGGKLAVINLSGTNTLRLTMASPQLNITKHTTGFNYMALVPALLVESATQVSGPYSLESNASVELATQRIIIPVGAGDTRFFRLQWDHQVTITSFKLAGGNLELTYQ